MRTQAKLILKDGLSFIGESFGAKRSVAGEVVFATGMVGYPEMMTDPSYKGQILVFTYPLQGNYGVPRSKHIHDLDLHFESSTIQVEGIIVSEYSTEHSHWNADQSLGQWLKTHNVPAITGVDTRELTQHLVQQGSCLGKVIINKEIEFTDPNKQDLVKQVTISKPKLYQPRKNRKNKKIVLIDCGVKNNIIHSFLKRGIDVLQVPYDYDYTNESFDGLFISNGPGDPTKCTKTITHLKQTLTTSTPIWGICLGNQLLALAAGAKTYKLKYGHRSQNQPCVLKGTKRCFITTQNHGYAVDSKTLPSGWEEYFVNANDGSNEGIRHKTKPYASCQFHPEAKAGPEDTEFLFDEFIEKL